MGGGEATFIAHEWTPSNTKNTKGGGEKSKDCNRKIPIREGRDPIRQAVHVRRSLKTSGLKRGRVVFL